MYLPVLAHPKINRKGERSFVRCGPGCLDDLYSMDDEIFAWLVSNGAAYLAQSDQSDGSEGR